MTRPKKPNMLVADSSSVSRRAICNLLQSICDVECLEAEDGLDAFEILQREEVELIVIDWNLPEIDGLMLARIIQLHPDYAHIKVVMIASDAHSEFVQKAIRARVSSYMVKPISPPDFRAKIQALVDGTGVPKLPRS